MPRTFPTFTGTATAAEPEPDPAHGKNHGKNHGPSHALDAAAGRPYASPIPSHAAPDPLSIAMRDFAHEVRNPIATIGSASDALARNEKRVAGGESGLSGEQRQRLLEIIRSEAERLRRMVTQYLDASTALLLTDRPCTERPLALVRELLDTCFPPGARSRIALSPTETDAELPPLAIEPDHLRQVFLNLLENALAAIALTDGRIDIEALASDDGVAFSVRDTGCGIPPSNLERIFADGFTTGGGTRRGLGLGIVRRLLERAGGRIAVVNNWPQGTLFTVHVPAAAPDATD